MKKDDTGAYTKAAFALLAVVSFAVLLFSLKRLYDHIRSTKHYTPLILFYSVLSGFLSSKRHPGRLLFFLDVAFDYPEWLYSLLNIIPVVLIFSASTVVSYIWYSSYRREIAIEFSPDHILNKDAKRLANQRNICLISLINSFYFALFVLSYSLLYPRSVLLLYRSHSVMRVEDIALCLLTSLLLYISGYQVTLVIRGLMRKDPPIRFLIVKAASITAFSIRAIANLILLVLETGGVDMTTSDLGYGVFLFCFFFVLDDLLLLVLLLLVYTQARTKNKLKPRGDSLNAIEIDTKLEGMTESLSSSSP